MTKPEFMQVYNLLDAVYELDFEGRKLDAWYEALKNVDYKKLAIAANRYIENEKFRPKPADLIKYASEVRPEVKKYSNFMCELCKCGFILVEHEVEGQPVVYAYRCKCSKGLSNAESIPIIKEEIINSWHRDIFGIYRLKPSNLTEVKREDFRKVAQQFGKWA